MYICIYIYSNNILCMTVSVRVYELCMYICMYISIYTYLHLHQGFIWSSTILLFYVQFHMVVILKFYFNQVHIVKHQSSSYSQAGLKCVGQNFKTEFLKIIKLQKLLCCYPPKTFLYYMTKILLKRVMPLRPFHHNIIGLHV